MPNDPFSMSGNGRSEDPATVADPQRNGHSPAAGSDRLRALLSMLWGGKWIVLAVFVVVVGGAAWYTYSIAPIYRTSTLLLVDQDQGQQVPTLTGGRRGQSSVFGRGRNLANEIFLLNQSGTIARRVSRRLDTMSTHPRTGARLEILYGKGGARRPVRSVAASVQGRIQARLAGRDVDAIQISTSSTVPSEAALIANLYAQEYIARTRERSRQSLQARETFLERQSERFRRDVDQTEQKLERYMRENGAVSLDQESSRIVQQLSKLEARRNELQIELDMKRAELHTKEDELAQVRPKLAERLSSGLGEELTRVQQEKADVELQINQIQQRYPDLTASGTSRKARELARLKERSKRLARRADSLAQRQVEQTLAAGGVGASAGEGTRGLTYVVEQQRAIAQQRIEVSGLESQLNTVEQRIREQRQRLKELPAQSLELAQIQRERRSAEKIQGYIREQLQQTRMALESEVGYAEIIQPAGIPGVPVSPNKERNLMLAAILGLLLGGGLVYLRERFDTYLRVPEDVRALGHSVIGVIPSMTELLDEQFGGGETVTIESTKIQSSVVMLTSSMSAVAESYRRLRASLRFARPDAELRSLVVTSPDKGEGKTTTATNLAVAMASAGRSTLLIDADLRHPRVHTFLGRQQSPGLSEALYQTSLDPKALETSVDDLSEMAAGEEVPNPAEQLGSVRMQRLIEQVEDHFDIVIIDTPPVLLFSDPLAIAPHADGSLLVAAANQTDERALDHAVELLDDVGAALIGTILNGYTVSARNKYGYGYRYRRADYGYRYGHRQLEDYYENGHQEKADFASTVRAWFN